MFRIMPSTRPRPWGVAHCHVLHRTGVRFTFTCESRFEAGGCFRKFSHHFSHCKALLLEVSRLLITLRTPLLQHLLCEAQIHLDCKKKGKRRAETKAKFLLGERRLVTSMNALSSCVLNHARGYPLALSFKDAIIHKHKATFNDWTEIFMGRSSSNSRRRASHSATDA